jgi:hypothetical protein
MDIVAPLSRCHAARVLPSDTFTALAYAPMWCVALSLRQPAAPIVSRQRQRPPKRRASSARPHPPPTPHNRSRPAPYPNMMCHSNDYDHPPLNYCTATNISLQYINFIEHV